MNILLAAFYTPAVRAVEYLIGMGFQTSQIRILTYDLDRNQALLTFAKMHNIDTKTFPIKSNEASLWIDEFKPDILFSLYFRDIIPAAILKKLPLGGVNLHGALLPEYRGTFSVPWAIINGEDFTGFTYHYMEPEIDTGNIIFQQKVAITPQDTAYSLYHKILNAGAVAFNTVFKMAALDRYPGIAQSGKAGYYPRKVPFDGYIDLSWNRGRIDRFIRAMYFPPFKGACVKLTDGREQEILSLEQFDTLVNKGKIQVRT